MKDLIGNTVEVGDRVAYTMPKYSQLRTGIVKKMTPKGISIFTGVRGEFVHRLKGQFILATMRYTPAPVLNDIVNRKGKSKLMGLCASSVFIDECEGIPDLGKWPLPDSLESNYSEVRV